MLENKFLQEIFESSYDRKKWSDVITAMLGKVDFYRTPAPIKLKKNDWNAEGHILGRFQTADEREVGIYEVSIGPNVRLEKNRVSLRNLLKEVYENDVDAALVIFNQGERWRFSYVSEIRTRNKVTGKVEKQATDPRRYTYVFGAKGAYRTPVKRFQQLTPGFVYLQDITKAFSVSELNTEFYNDVVTYFYQLTGASIGKGKSKTEYKALLKLPSTPKDDKKTYQEFAVRLIGRIIFCWFLKHKKSDSGKSLLPEELLSSVAVKNYENYYHQILELLFFQVLNTPVESRKQNLPQGSDWIPFLNGGLFEAHPHDFYSADRQGISKNINTLQISDTWFSEFFARLEQYNFTIDENSIDDAEVSIDPEMLGRIFENLLAELDPDTGESARKATGSFYTPREIVDYMVGESLTQYLYKHTGINKERIHALFNLNQQVAIGANVAGESICFSHKEAEMLLTELDKIKIFDPACGSGAFPIGALQKLVLALEKLDKDALWWRDKQVEKITNVFLRKQLKKKLDTATVDYTRKLGLIQNNIYGVDIQPIAAEISKLRCFLTLIVDEKIDDKKENRGVEPLPNLEFKFIAANTLYKLPQDLQGDIFGTADAQNQLHQIRLDYLQAFGEEKDELKKKFKQLQTKIFKQESKHNKNKDSRSMKLAAWDPFKDECTPWFDAEWMYGVSQFEVVIGNPPYGGDKIEDSIKTELALGSKDPYGAFIARFLHKPTMKTHLKSGGVLCFIVSDTFMTIKTHLPLRELLMGNVMHKMVRVHPDTFKATVNTAIILIERHENLNAKSQPPTEQLLMGDLTRISIHDQHQEFLRLLRKTVSYSISLKTKEAARNENGILLMKGDCVLPANSTGKWTSESSDHYAVYTYPQLYIRINSNLPFFVASPKLFVITNDITAKLSTQKIGKKTVSVRHISLNDKEISVVKLGDIGDVKQGLATGDNDSYLFQNPEARGNYKSIDDNRQYVLTEKDLDIIRKDEKLRLSIVEKGISKGRQDSTRYFGGRYIVPYDKGGESDSDEGWMPNYFVPTNYFIDWSEWAVKRMKTYTIAQRIIDNKETKEIKEHYKTTNCAVFRSTHLYFTRGISFSRTGVYSPTFRLGSLSVFDTEGSMVFFDYDTESLNELGMLTSMLSKYFLKCFIGHTVHTQVDELKEFMLFAGEVPGMTSLVEAIVSKQKKDLYYDYSRGEQIEIDTLVFEAYGLEDNDILEVENWYARKYPKLVNATRKTAARKNAVV